MSSTPKKSSTSKKPAAARAKRGNDPIADKKGEGREARNGETATKEVTLRAFRRTYDRLHPRKDK